MPTGQEIREELSDWGLVLLLGTAVGTGAAGYITDTTRLQNPMLPSTAFDNCYIRITSGASEDEDGEQRMVDYLDSINGRLYVTQDLSGNITGNTYEIWRPGLDPDDVDRARDKALTEVCSKWALQPVSEIANADYEDDLASSNWQVVGSGSAAIQALSFPYTFVRNSILLTSGAANDYIESESLYCRPSRKFYLYIPVSAQVGTGTVSVRDITNGADITLSGTAAVTGRGWTGIEVTGNIPADCYEITVRLTSSGSSDVVEWGPCFFQWRGQQRISVPDRIVSRKDVGPIFRIDSAPEVSDTDSWGHDRKIRLSSVSAEEQNDSVSLRFPQPMLDAPHLYSERIYYDALQTAYQAPDDREEGDDATTTCPMNYVVPAMVKVLAEQYLAKQPWDLDFWRITYAKALDKLSVAERHYGPRTEAHQEWGRPYAVPYVKV